jgi:thiol:disulfide interchange protein DsbA
MRKILFISLCLVFAPFGSLTAAEFREGVEYELIKPPQPTQDPARIEVVEMFWYGCPHCYRLEPLVKEWNENKADDVDFIQLPAMLGPRWELLARAYYTAEILGVLDKVHTPLFETIHEKRKPFRNEADLQKFFAEHGVDEETFQNTFRSFAVVTKVNRSRQLTQRYGINGVPAFVINGKYRTSPGMAGSKALTFKVVDELIAQERDALAKTNAQ